LVWWVRPKTQKKREREIQLETHTHQRGFGGSKCVGFQRGLWWATPACSRVGNAGMVRDAGGIDFGFQKKKTKEKRKNKIKSNVVMPRQGVRMDLSVKSLGVSVAALN